MYQAHIDEENQCFIIEDRQGNVVASRDMPTRNTPNPGKEVLMEYPGNLEAWQRIYDLVAAANKGRGRD